MTAKDVYEILKHFIDNDFRHVKVKIDWIFTVLIVFLLGIIATLLKLNGVW